MSHCLQVLEFKVMEEHTLADLRQLKLHECVRPPPQSNFFMEDYLDERIATLSEVCCSNAGLSIIEEGCTPPPVAMEIAVVRTHHSMAAAGLIPVSLGEARIHMVRRGIRRKEGGRQMGWAICRRSGLGACRSISLALCAGLGPAKFFLPALRQGGGGRLRSAIYRNFPQFSAIGFEPSRPQVPAPPPPPRLRCNGYRLVPRTAVAVR